MHREPLQQPQKQNHSIRECCNSPKAESSAPNAANRLYWHASSESSITHSWCPLCHLPGSVVLLFLLPIRQPSLGGCSTQGEGKHISFVWPPPPLSPFSLSHTCDTLFPLQILTVTFSHTEIERQQGSQDLTPVFYFLITDAATLWRKCYFWSLTVFVSFHFRLANFLNSLWPLTTSRGYGALHGYTFISRVII